jgi:hypothetical protein
VHEGLRRGGPARVVPAPQVHAGAVRRSSPDPHGIRECSSRCALEGLELDGPSGSDQRLVAIGLAMEKLFGGLPAPR